MRQKLAYVALIGPDHLESVIPDIEGLSRRHDVDIALAPRRDGHLAVVKGEPDPVLAAELNRIPGVLKVLDGRSATPLADRSASADPTVADVGGIPVGGVRPVVIAGPCSAETPEVLHEAAAAVSAAGASMLRVGMFKPRTSPYAFQGLRHDGMAVIDEVRAEYGLPVVSEVMSVRDLDLMAEHVDVLQIGARNMQNFSLLIEAGASGRPVLLKRAMSATVSEWLGAAEYLIANGCDDVILCERGIRSYDQVTRFTLDLSVIPAIRERTHLPIVIDPSHGTGNSRYVPSMSSAAIAAGADGLIIEVHPRPHEALSDSDQSLDFPEFGSTMTTVSRVAEAVDRPLAGSLGVDVPFPAPRRVLT